MSELKNRLLDGLVADERDEFVRSSVRLAVEDAASLAWASPYPLLLLPELLNEKVSEARQRAARQRRIQDRSREFLSLTE
jgi:hypothetical protein